jgi:hypothetical protein
MNVFRSGYSCPFNRGSGNCSIAALRKYPHRHRAGIRNFDNLASTGKRNRQYVTPIRQMRGNNEAPSRSSLISVNSGRYQALMMISRPES